MYPCNKCLENNWQHKYYDGWICSTCQTCGNEVEFETKQKWHPKPGEPCRCDRAIIEIVASPFKPSKLKKLFYYTHSYYCPACKTHFSAEEFKVYNNLDGGREI